MSPKRTDLQGIRGIAILLVLAFHLKPNYFPYGFIGVDMFFVLSGYLMTMILSKKTMSFSNTGDFYIRRFKRIVPLYTVVLTGAAILSVAELNWQLGHYEGHEHVLHVPLESLSTNLPGIHMYRMDGLEINPVIFSALKPGKFWFYVALVFVICVLIFFIYGPVEQTNEWIQDMIDNIETNYISNFRTHMKETLFLLLFFIVGTPIAMYFSQQTEPLPFLDFLELDMKIDVLSLRALCCSRILKTRCTKLKKESDISKDPYWRTVIDAWPDIDSDVAMTLVRQVKHTPKLPPRLANEDRAIKVKWTFNEEKGHEQWADGFMMI